MVSYSRSSTLVTALDGFAPPGDIHRVRNAGDERAISIHVCGTDVSRTGSSVHRYYDHPVVCD
jgi:predicted metal-dependent enzyme (double-stranded beta helix superfamily)